MNEMSQLTQCALCLSGQLTLTVIASAAKQSTSTPGMDCFVGFASSQ